MIDMTDRGLAFPKPSPKIEDRIGERRTAKQQAKDFRLAVWRRDEGRCQQCGRRVLKTLEAIPERGEVHHVIPLSIAPESRYDVENGRLVCARCHGKIQRHEIAMQGQG